MRRLIALLLTLLIACAPVLAQAESSDITSPPGIEFSETPTPAPTATPIPTPTPSPTPVPTPTFEETVAAYANERFKARKIVGGAVIIARDGEIVFSFEYGSKLKHRYEPITADTCYRIASVTKLVSVIGLMQLLEEKDISLETPVKDIVGFHVVNPSFPEEPVTIRQVLSHTSGLVQVQQYHPNWEKIRPGNLYWSTTVRPGARYEYSNLNGGLIGAMIEALSGQSVNTYMQEHVFGPLGVTAAYHPALLPEGADIAPRLNKKGNNAQTVEKALATFDEYNDTCDPRQNTDKTSGGLYINASGMIRIASMLQRGGELDGVRILPEETVQLMMQDQQTVPGSSVRCDSVYGLAMARVENMPGGTWYGHQGKMEGLASNLYFQPDTGLSIAVISNGYESHNIDGVASIARVMMEKAQEFLNK